MKNYNKFMTGFWLVLAILGLLVAFYFMWKDGWQKGSVYLIFPLLAGMMYGFRIFMLKRMDRQNRDQE